VRWGVRRNYKPKEFYQRKGASLGGRLVFRMTKLSQFRGQVLEAAALPLLTNFMGSPQIELRVIWNVL
jgi:hypothetical protein